MGKRINRISTKFILGVTAILVLSLALSVAANKGFTWRYCLHRQAQEMREAGERLRKLLGEDLMPEEAVEALEAEREVLAVWSDASSDSETLSDELREKFRQKGLGFERFWLWEGDYTELVKRGERLRLYQQDRLHYGILTEYLTEGGNTFAIASIVPNIQDAVDIINKLLLLITGFALALAALLTVFLVGRITRPLGKLAEFAQRMARQEYAPLCIRTGDELEMVAESMNSMGKSIQEYQEKLLKKNRQMEELLNNVAHDLKTPISLVGMYAAGMRDGMDDGTFLDTIIRQNRKMAALTEQLLDWSRIGQRDYREEQLNASEILQCQAEEFLPVAEKGGLAVRMEIEPAMEILGSRELLEALFSNLISNAVKYAAGGEIRIRLWREKGGPVFSIINETGGKEIDTERIWEPFYVGEESRNSELSGTGLGLPIVRKIAEKSGYRVRCFQSGEKIEFRAELYREI